MMCKLENQKPDWNAYALGEMDARARRDAEIHAASCEACQEELASLRITLDALAALHEEELPRRIAFVSDKVFETRWWQRLLAGILKPSFAGAALVAAAILVHAFVRPVAIQQTGRTQVVQPGNPAETAAIDSRISAAVRNTVKSEVERQVRQQFQREFDARMQTAVRDAVNKAVAYTRAKDDERTARLLAAAQLRYNETAELLSRQMTQLYAANTGLAVR